MNKESTLAYIDSKWESWFVEGLADFVRIPNLSLLYDPEFATNGLIERAIDHVE